MAKLDDKKKCKKFPFADVLKWAIFSLVMLAPFGAVLGKVCYTTFNKNAYVSWSSNKNKYNSGETVNNSNNLVSNEWYHFDSSVFTHFNTGEYISYSAVGNVQYANNNINLENNILTQGARFRLYNDFVIVWDSQMNSLGNIAYNSYRLQFDFQFTSMGVNIDISNYGITTINNETEGELDNAFYYAIDQINEQPIFNWTQNTAMYTVIDNMTNDLEINTSGNILATLLTYWTLNTAVYLIFDVVIHFSTKLVHMFSGE